MTSHSVSAAIPEGPALSSRLRPSPALQSKGHYAQNGFVLLCGATSITPADVYRGGDYVVIDLGKGGVATPAYREDRAAGKRHCRGRPGEPPRAQPTINFPCKNRSAEVAQSLARGTRFAALVR